MLLLSSLAPLFPIIIGWHKRFSILWWYALTGLCFDLMPYISKDWFHIGFYWLGNVYLGFEYFLLSFYYRNKVFKNKALFLCVFTTGIIIYITYTTCQHGSWLVFNYDATSFFNLYYLILSIIGFYFLLKEQRILFLDHSSFFWVNVAVLISSSGIFFIFLLRNTIEATDPKAMDILWDSVFLSLNILKNILLGIALSKKEER